MSEQPEAAGQPRDAHLDGGEHLDDAHLDGGGHLDGAQLDDAHPDDAHLDGGGHPDGAHLDGGGHLDDAHLDEGGRLEEGAHLDEGSPDEPLPAGRPEVTDPRIAEALARLEGLADRPAAEHVEAYEDAHRVLQEALTQAQEQRPAPRPGQPGGATP